LLKLLALLLGGVGIINIQAKWIGVPEWIVPSIGIAIPTLRTIDAADDSNGSALVNLPCVLA
jgi:hypothetical protein